jgi:acetyl esterase
VTLAFRLAPSLRGGEGSLIAANAVVEHSSPIAHYPVAIEQGYATAQWIVREAPAIADPGRIAIAGDAVAGV